MKSTCLRLSKCIQNMFALKCKKMTQRWVGVGSAHGHGSEMNTVEGIKGLSCGEYFCLVGFAGSLCLVAGGNRSSRNNAKAILKNSHMLSSTWIGCLLG